jgi:hypothetical protein
MTRDDIGFGASTIIAVAGAVAALKFDSTLGTIATVGGAAVATCINYLKARRAERNAMAIAEVGANAVIDTNSKSVLVQAVTAERAKWRTEMRELAAELATLLRAADRRVPVDWGRVDRLRAELRLRLNPVGRVPAPPAGDVHDLDRRLHATLTDVATMVVGGQVMSTSAAADLEDDMADLLKAEWEKSKSEAASGILGGLPETASAT